MDLFIYLCIEKFTDILTMSFLNGSKYDHEKRLQKHLYSSKVIVNKKNTLYSTFDLIHYLIILKQEIAPYFLNTSFRIACISRYR